MRQILLILALMIANILAACSDFTQYVSDMSVNAGGNYDEATGGTQATVGMKLHFRDPQGLPNYSKDKSSAPARSRKNKARPSG